MNGELEKGGGTAANPCFQRWLNEGHLSQPPYTLESRKDACPRFIPQVPERPVGRQERIVGVIGVHDCSNVAVARAEKYSSIPPDEHFQWQVDFFVHGIGTGGCIAGVGALLYLP